MQSKLQYRSGLKCGYPNHPLPAAIIGGLASRFVIVFIIVVAAYVIPINTISAEDIAIVLVFIPAGLLAVWGVLSPAQGWNPFLYGILVAGIHLAISIGLLVTVGKGLFELFQ